MKPIRDDLYMTDSLSPANASAEDAAEAPVASAGPCEGATDDPSPDASPERPLRKRQGRYHHGALRPALVALADEMLERDGVAALSLRSLARAAGVSQTAPYRHFADREALLAAVAVKGFERLKARLMAAARAARAEPDEAAVAIGGAYISFATDHPAHFRLMFGREIAGRKRHEELLAAAEDISAALGDLLDNHALGLGMWATMHGLAWLLIEDVVDLGETRNGAIPSRAEVVLRSLLAAALPG